MSSFVTGLAAVPREAQLVLTGLAGFVELSLLSSAQLCTAAFVKTRFVPGHLASSQCFFDPLPLSRLDNGT